MSIRSAIEFVRTVIEIAITGRMLSGSVATSWMLVARLAALVVGAVLAVTGRSRSQVHQPRLALYLRAPFQLVPAALLLLPAASPAVR